MIDSILSQLAHIIRNYVYFAPLLAFLAGILTSFMPCTLAAIPLVIGYVKGAGGEDDPRKAFKLSFIFAFGMAVSFTAMGAAAATLGMFLGGANRYLHIIGGVLMLLMALQIWEVYTFIPASNLVSKSSRKGYLGALIAGMLIGLLGSACATPVLVVLLAMVARGANPLFGILCLFLFALGHGILVVVAGSGTGIAGKITKNPAYGKISNVIRVTMGFVMTTFGLYLIHLFF
ncbi:MAG: sulfite exporter TauE/SafE family protein [Defluviitaleaceae bacterium]|nr:sulfite exporter TauE/SafE family protein [Defluviitaleaceae bacterium]